MRKRSRPVDAYGDNHRHTRGKREHGPVARLGQPGHGTRHNWPVRRARSPPVVTVSSR